MTKDFHVFYKNWSVTISFINLTGLLFAITNHSIIPWFLAVFLLFGYFLLRISDFTSKLPLLIGYPNIVSSIRLTLVLIAFIFQDYFNSTTLLLIFLLAISLDGLDGYLARKLNQSTEIGGKFDMEIDAFMVLVISWIHVDQNRLNWFILIPGSLKYIYEILFIWLPKKEGELMPKFYRASIAVLFFIGLLFPFITDFSPLILITYISGGLIIVSFAISTCYHLGWICRNVKNRNT